MRRTARGVGRGTGRRCVAFRGAIPREATILATLKRSFPGVEDVHLSLGGVGRHHLYVKLNKTQEGEGENVLHGAFAAHYDIKQAVVVDKDVDIHAPSEVDGLSRPVSRPTATS